MSRNHRTPVVRTEGVWTSTRCCPSSKQEARRGDASDGPQGHRHGNRRDADDRPGGKGLGVSAHRKLTVCVGKVDRWTPLGGTLGLPPVQPHESTSVRQGTRVGMRLVASTVRMAEGPHARRANLAEPIRASRRVRPHSARRSARRSAQRWARRWALRSSQRSSRATASLALA